MAKIIKQLKNVCRRFAPEALGDVKQACNLHHVQDWL